MDSNVISNQNNEQIDKQKYYFTYIHIPHFESLRTDIWIKLCDIIVITIILYLLSLLQQNRL